MIEKNLFEKKLNGIIDFLDLKFDIKNIYVKMRNALNAGFLWASRTAK